MNRVPLIEAFVNDVRYAWRMFRRRPGFALAAILAAYSVAKRYKEIGIRLAVGASRADVARLVLGRAVATAALGAAVGVGVAMAAAPLLAAIVYQASPRNPMVIAGVAAILGALGVLSCWAPLDRSLHIDPMAAVRAD